MQLMGAVKVSAVPSPVTPVMCTSICSAHERDRPDRLFHKMVLPVTVPITRPVLALMMTTRHLL